MFSIALVALTLAASALANIFVTNPVESTTYQAGQPAKVTWQDSGSTPLLATFGPATIAIYVGNALQQTLLQTIGTSVDVANVSTLNFTPDPTIGPNSNEYFIRFQSLNLKDATNPTYPALAFSSRFSLAGMTGKFTPAIQSEIDGQTTAPIVEPTTTANASASHVSATTSATTVVRPVSTVSSTAASASKTATPNAGSKIELTGLVSMFGVASLIIANTVF